MHQIEQLSNIELMSVLTELHCDNVHDSECDGVVLADVKCRELVVLLQQHRATACFTVTVRNPSTSVNVSFTNNKLPDDDILDALVSTVDYHYKLGLK